jgi:hypothetical protein
MKVSSLHTNGHREHSNVLVPRIGLQVRLAPLLVRPGPGGQTLVPIAVDGGLVAAKVKERVWPPIAGEEHWPPRQEYHA